MCEIAAISGRTGGEQLRQLAEFLYNQNDDGIGVAAINVVERDGERKFDSTVVKNTDFSDAADAIEVLGDQMEPWRYIVHARLTTAGGNGWDQTHPIMVTDTDVESEWVIHNGIVRGHEHQRKQLQELGHEFNTTVDSEVIPHEHGDLPTADAVANYDPDADDNEFEQPFIGGRLNYILFNEDRILVRNTGKYTVTQNMLITCQVRNYDVDSEWDDEEAFMLFTPDGRAERCPVDTARSFTSSGGTVSQATYGRQSNWSRSNRSRSNRSRSNRSRSRSSQSQGSAQTASSRTTSRSDSDEQSHDGSEALKLPNVGEYPDEVSSSMLPDAWFLLNEVHKYDWICTKHNILFYDGGGCPYCQESDEAQTRLVTRE